MFHNKEGTIQSFCPLLHGAFLRIHKDFWLRLQIYFLTQWLASTTILMFSLFLFGGIGV
jgi:hypothetical protein